MPPRRESRQFFMSVEGANCETLYFNHLAKLIKECEESSYLLKIDPKVMSPYDFAKRNYYKPQDRRRRTSKRLPYIHIQDIEDYRDAKQKDKFLAVLQQMKKAEREFGVDYMLGYSNYTFELWMLLHVADMNYAVANRRAYLNPINKYFNKKYKKLDDYKKHDEFQSILEDYVTLETVFDALDRAQRIEEANATDPGSKVTYAGYEFFSENPSLSVHEVVRLIFDTCHVKRPS